MTRMLESAAQNSIKMLTEVWLMATAGLVPGGRPLRARVSAEKTERF